MLLYFYNIRIKFDYNQVFVTNRQRLMLAVDKVPFPIIRLLASQLPMMVCDLVIGDVSEKWLFKSPTYTNRPYK